MTTVIRDGRSALAFWLGRRSLSLGVATPDPLICTTGRSAVVGLLPLICSRPSLLRSGAQYPSFDFRRVERLCTTGHSARIETIAYSTSDDVILKATALLAYLVCEQNDRVRKYILLGNVRQER